MGSCWPFTGLATASSRVLAWRHSAAGRTALGPDLVDIPVDLEVIPIRVPEFQGNLAPGTPAALEDDGHVVLPQPGPRAEHLVHRAHLEGEVIEAAALAHRGPADEGHAVVVGIAAEKDHAARHHGVRVAIADLEAQHLGVKAQRRLQIGDVQHDMPDLPQLELHRGLP